MFLSFRHLHASIRYLILHMVIEKISKLLRAGRTHTGRHTLVGYTNNIKISTLGILGMDILHIFDIYPHISTYIKWKTGQDNEDNTDYELKKVFKTARTPQVSHLL